MACGRSFIVKTRSPSTLLGVTSQIIGKQKLATCLSKQKKAKGNRNIIFWLDTEANVIHDIGCKGNNGT
ncbi:hypothetical protein YC2023_122188 [Brassica napus]